MYVGMSIARAMAGNADPCPRKPWRGGFRVRYNSFCFLDSYHLGSNDATWKTFSSESLEHLEHEYNITHCAPASKALLMRSECVIRNRTRGDTPNAAIAAVEACIEQSVICPCSQSMMTPLDSFSKEIDLHGIRYTDIDASLGYYLGRSEGRKS